MDLTEDDIIDAIESYRLKNDRTNAEMAVLCGMANGSVYFKWVNKITAGGKIKYVTQFLKNTKKSLNDLFPNRNIPFSGNIIDTVNEARITTYSCTDCINKQKEIDALKAALDAKDELLEIYRHKKNEMKCG